MAKTGITSKLKALNRKWKKAVPKRAGAPLPPNEDFEARLESAVVEISKGEKKRLQIHYVLTIVTKGYEGKKAHKWRGLDTEENLDKAQGDLEAMGLDIPDSMEGLGPVLEEAVGIGVAIRTWKIDENTGFNFVDRIDLEDDEDKEDDDDDDADADDDDDDDDEEGYTYEQVMKMKKQELVPIAEELDLDPDDYEKLSELREAVADELELEPDED